jgi:3-oxoadipate enol-lactonase
VRATGLESFVDPVVERWFAPAFTAHYPHVVREYKEIFAKLPVDGYAASCEVVGRLDLRTDIGCIAAPTMVISGADDLAIPPTHGAAIADAIPGAVFAVVADAAHLANVEQPDEVTRLMLEHLQGEE